MTTTKQTVETATLNGPVVCMMGKDRAYAIGDIAYRFRRPLSFEGSPPNTFPDLAIGTPVMWVNDKWVHTQLNKPILLDWSREVTVLD